MTRISVTLPANDPARPGEARLDRDDLWQGLRCKAEDAVPFVPGMAECTVLERTATGLVREVVVNGERIREEVTFSPPDRISFLHTGDDVGWLIHNDIGEDASGELTLTFVSETTARGGAEPDEEQQERKRAAIERVVANTIAVIRATVAGDKAVSAEGI